MENSRAKETLGSHTPQAWQDEAANHPTTRNRIPGPPRKPQYLECTSGATCGVLTTYGESSMIATAKTSESKPDNAGSTGTELIGRKPGAQPGNRNQWRHGLFCSKTRFSYVDKRANEFRRCLEDAVVASFDGIDVRRAGLVHSCVEATRAAMSNRRLLDESADKIAPELWMAFQKQYLQCLDMRDKKLRELGLPSDPFDRFKSLYDRPIPAA